MLRSCYSLFCNIVFEITLSAVGVSGDIVNIFAHLLCQCHIAIADMFVCLRAIYCEQEISEVSMHFS